jgi:epidermal growth factor receptor substrate 15
MSNRSQPPTSVFAQATLPPLAPTSSSFLDEVDHAERTSLLASRSAALETVQADHTSTTASLANLTTQRATLEEALSVTTASLNQLHASLSTARTAYEEERLLVDSLSERQASQSSLLSRARAELISAESDLSGVRVTRGEIEGGYLRDKEELRGLTLRAAEVEKELEKEKTALEKETNDGEKIRDEARAVREKLSAMEFERGTIAQDLIGVRELNSKASEVEASSPFDHVSPTSSATKEEGIEKPALTSVKSNNPFDRMTSLLSSSTPTSPSSAPLTSPSAVPAFSPISTTRSIESATGSPISNKVVAGSATLAVAGAGATIGFGIEGVDAEKEDNDPFGMPIANDKKEEGKSSFDDMFGDDFSSTSAPVDENIAPEPITTAAKGKGKEVVEEDSSDDDDEAEEIEEATPATPRRSIPTATNATYASVAGHTQEKSSSDSSSFVHVSAFSDSNEVESKFPALDEEQATVVTSPISDSATMQQVEPGHASKVGSEIDRSPKSDGDLFEDATAGTDDDHGLPTSPAQPTESSSSMMMGAGAGLIAGGTAAAVVAAKKRTAPPPPPSRSATIPLSGLNASSPLASNPATTVSPSRINAADDFDKAFDDFPTTKSTAANTASAFGGAPKRANTDFDDFDDEFDDAFGTSTSPVKSPLTTTTSPAAKRTTSSAFDDSFADFDSAFDPPSSKSPSPPPTFDSLISSAPSSAPKLPGRPSAPPPTIARPDDVKGIKDIVAMGFTRDQAVTALESHNVRLLTPA